MACFIQSLYNLLFVFTYLLIGFFLLRLVISYDFDVTLYLMTKSFLFQRSRLISIRFFYIFALTIKFCDIKFSIMYRNKNKSANLSENLVVKLRDGLFITSHLLSRITTNERPILGITAPLLIRVVLCI